MFMKNGYPAREQKKYYIKFSEYMGDSSECQ